MTEITNIAYKHFIEHCKYKIITNTNMYITIKCLKYYVLRVMKTYRIQKIFVQYLQIF